MNVSCTVVAYNQSEEKINDWNVNLIDTGPNTLTGGRVKRLEKFLLLSD